MKSALFKKALSRRGFISGLAILMMVVMLTMMTGYFTQFTTDNNAGQELSYFQQIAADRNSVEQIVKEAVLYYYESALFGDAPVDPLETVINTALGQLNNSSIDLLFVLDTAASPLPVMPTNSANFLCVNLSGGNTPFGDGFELFPIAGQSPTIRRVDRYLNPNMSRLIVAPATTTDAEGHRYTFVIRRTGPGGVGRVDVTYTVSLKMYQVPLTDFNLLGASYVKDGYPAMLNTVVPLTDAGGNPLQLSANINNGTLFGMCTSWPQDNQSLGNVVQWPNYYREALSAGSVAWEYFWESDACNQQFIDNATLAIQLDDPAGFLGDPSVVAPDPLFPVSAANPWTINIDAIQGTVILYSRTGPSPVVNLIGTGAAGNPLTIISSSDNPGLVRIQLNLDTTTVARPIFLRLNKTNLNTSGDTIFNTASIFLDNNADINGGHLLNIGVGTFAFNANSLTQQAFLRNLTIGAGVADGFPFRTISPRFLMIDSESTMNIVKMP
jgi:hypothetical protein